MKHLELLGGDCGLKITHNPFHITGWNTFFWKCSLCCGKATNYTIAFVTHTRIHLGWNSEATVAVLQQLQRNEESRIWQLFLFSQWAADPRELNYHFNSHGITWIRPQVWEPLDETYEVRFLPKVHPPLSKDHHSCPLSQR